MLKLVKVLLTQTALGDLIGRVPGTQALYGRAVWQRTTNLFFGVHPDFAAAEAAAARLKPTGWNDPAIAGLLVSGRAGEDAGPPPCGADFQPSFYPVLFWLSRLLRPGMQVVDLGGAGGIAFEIARRYGVMPDGARWHVVDLPELVRRGAERHAADGGRTITFGTRLADAPAAGLLLSGGCLQYLPDPLGLHGPGMLDEVTQLPRHLILNKLPLTEGEPFVTVQNLVATAAPYHVFNRRMLLDRLAAKGYRPLDEWRVAELSVDVPFHARRAVPYFAGLLLGREDGNTSEES